jgi:hypothetical protein
MYSKVRKSQTRKVEEKEKLNSITGTGLFPPYHLLAGTVAGSIRAGKQQKCIKYGFQIFLVWVQNMRRWATFSGFFSLFSVFSIYSKSTF